MPDPADLDDADSRATGAGSPTSCPSTTSRTTSRCSTPRSARRPKRGATSTSSSSTSTTAAVTTRSSGCSSCAPPTPRVTVLSLSRNFGHQLAVTAGLDLVAEDASADAVIVMDTDLQDPPRVSLEMLDLWEDGVDVVYGQRRSRKDTRLQAEHGVRLLLGARPAGLDRDPAQRRRLPADGRQGRGRGRPLPRARPVPARHRRRRRLPAGGAALRPRRAVRRRDRLPAAQDAELRRQRHPRLLHGAAADDQPARHLHLAAQRAAGGLRRSTSGSSTPTSRCPAGRSSASACSCSAASS